MREGRQRDLDGGGFDRCPESQIPAQPVQRPPPATIVLAVDVGDEDPPLADPPDVEDDLQSEVASLRRELARRDAELKLKAGEDTDTIMQLAAKAALAGVSQEIEKVMEGDNTRTILMHALL